MKKKNKTVKASNLYLCSCILLQFLLFSCNSYSTETENDSEYSLYKKFDLPDDIRESSGLIVYDSVLYTFNDGGNDPVLYGIDIITGNIIRKIYFENYNQIDWEDITHDSLFIYIGDFGNNLGSRENLFVLRIAKDKIQDIEEQNVTADSILFHYPDQVDFTDNAHATSFDCEAMVSYGDSLLLFTKDWINYTTTIYQIPKISGEYCAQKAITIKSEGLVTAADYNTQTHQLVLIGYSEYIPFIHIIDSFKINDIMVNNYKHISFDEFSGVQVEGVSFLSGSIYISSEGTNYQQAIYTIIKK